MHMKKSPGKSVKSNMKPEIKAGKPQKQAAANYSGKREAGKKK